MEQNPFHSTPEDEDSSTLESVEESEKKDTKKSKKRRIPLFDLKDKEEKPSETPKKSSRESLFGGIIVSGEKQEAQQHTEQKVTAEHTNESELTEQFEEVVEERLHSVEEELVSAASVDDATESLASVDFLETVADRLDEGVPPEIAIDSAVEELVEAPVDADPEEIVEFLSTESIPEPSVEIDEEDDPTVPIVPTVVAVAVPSSSSAARGARTASSGGGSAPPPPPPPVGRAGHSMPMPGGGPPHGGSTYNTLPASSSVDRDPNVVQMNEFYYRNRRSGDLLLGGVVGYLLGRRRGRIKTEKKLQPEIDSRDKKLDELKDKLQDSEAQVRAKALEQQQKTARLVEEHEKQLHQVRSKQETVVLPKHIDTIQEEKQAFLARAQAFEQQVVDTEPSAATKVAEVLVESAAFLAAPALMQTEALAVERGPETAKPEVSDRSETKAPEKIKRDVRFMRLSELLEVAESIPVGSTNLREVYAGKQLDVVNLRRIITEYARGASVDKLIKNSMEAYELRSELRHEIKSEDDQRPVFAGLSDTSASNLQQVATQAGAASVALRSEAGGGGVDPQDTAQENTVNETEPEVLLSNGTAIVLGVLAGIGIMMFYLLVVQ